MTETADIISKTRVSDNAGGSTVTTSTQEDVPCRRMENLAGNVEVQLGGKLVSNLQWRFAFPYGTTISEDSEIVQSGQRFAVLGVMSPRSYETCVRVMAVKK